MNFKENESPEKLRGGYYTDSDIAGSLLQWVLEPGPASLLEPSCGDGAFLRALRHQNTSSLRAVTACEIDATEAAKAERSAWEAAPGIRTVIHVRDFLDWYLQRHNAPPDFDAVVGNPPFIRYQYLDSDLQARAESLIRLWGLPFTKHTNIWVPFVIASLARLRPGGRLAMVVPAELLHVLHAQSARDFLLKQCARVVIIDPTEIWFDKTLQGVVLLLAEKRAKTPSPQRARLAIESVTGRGFLEKGLSRVVESASYMSGGELPGKWMAALLSRAERNTLESARHNPGIVPFASLASVAVGIVTGANKFFLVPDSVVDAFELREFAHPMFGRSEHVPGLIYDSRVHAQNRQAGLPTNFIWFNGAQRKNLSRKALTYVESGEAQGIHRRFKCRIREPWYSVPSVFTTSVAMLKRSHDFPRLVLNRYGAFTTDTAYRIEPTAVGAQDLVAGFVNSLTALCCELEGRHYGGGVLELVPSEIGRILVPQLTLNNGRLARLDIAFRKGASAEAILEEQDSWIMERVGVRRADSEALHHAWRKLRDRRHRAST